MSGEFVLESAELFDEVIVDSQGKPISTKPLTLGRHRDAFRKFLVTRISGEPGSYTTALKLEPPSSYGPAGFMPSENTVIPAGRTVTVVHDIAVVRPTAGVYKITVYFGDAALGSIEVKL